MSAIAVVAKQCVPGRVKTRLTPPLSPERAAAVAQASLDMVLDAVRECGIELVLAGHIHRPELFHLGYATIVCAGSATKYKVRRGNFVHLLEIAVSHGRATFAGRRDFAFDDTVFAFRQI